MDTLVVQAGIRHGRAADLARSHDGMLSIGRGYGNDLVLTDLHVAPQQLAFYRDGLQWKMMVLDHTNPVLLNGKQVSGESAVVQSGDTITIGRTRLAIFSAEHPVERTRKLVLSNWLARDVESLYMPIAILLAVCLFDLLLGFFEGSTDLKWEDAAYSEMFAVVLIVLWAGLWSLAGRIFRHQQQFGLQLMATVAVFLFASLLSLVGGYLAYSFHSTMADEILGWGVFFIVLVVLFRLNLIIATNIGDTRLVSVVLGVVVTGLTYGFLRLGQADEFHYEAEYSSVVKPPFAHIISGISADDYFSRVAKKVPSPDG
jgi:pSer/pThr/pTyr-binding forkhead associated (FHA) protein